MLVTALTLIGSIMTSYIKAVGVAHGFTFRVGCSRRQECRTILCMGLIFSFPDTPLVSWRSYEFAPFSSTLANLPNLPMTVAVTVLALTANITALQLTFPPLC